MTEKERAIEAAAKALHARVYGPGKWDAETERQRRIYRLDMVAALAAADAVRLDLAIPDAMRLANGFNSPVFVVEAE